MWIGESVQLNKVYGVLEKILGAKEPISYQT